MIWFSGGLVSVRSEVGLDDLGSLFQPRRFCDSVILGSWARGHGTVKLFQVNGVAFAA